MNRRKALKNLVIASGSLITLPSWMGCGTGDLPGTHLSTFSYSEQQLLAAITDTIIPAGDGVGALSMEVDKFLQKLIDDCYEKDIQDNVHGQLKALARSSQTFYEKSFAGCTQEEREELLLKFSVSSNKSAKDFFTLMKSETVRGFNTSKEIMEKYYNYKIAPGHYYGCVDLKT